MTDFQSFLKKPKSKAALHKASVSKRALRAETNFFFSSSLKPKFFGLYCGLYINSNLCHLLQMTHL